MKWRKPLNTYNNKGVRKHCSEYKETDRRTYQVFKTNIPEMVHSVLAPGL